MSGCTPATTAAPAGGSSQKKATIAIDPVTRIEGHLKAEVVVENGVVVDAQLSGGMFRGFEQILRGRDPRDASQIVQRICGVCPTAHATASVMALDQAFGVKVPTNGRVTRNLIFAANYLQSHLLHFYHLSAQDFVQGPDSAPFVPRFKQSDLRLPAAVNKVAVDQYLEALEMRRICHEMVALFGGRMPHVQGMVVGGTTEVPTRAKILEFAARFKKVRAFVETKYLPVVYAVGAAYKDDMFSFGQGYRNAFCCGAFPLTDGGTQLAFKRGVYINGKDAPMDPRKIKEYVKYSWFDDATTGLPINEGKTVPAADKPGAYSFVKAPRYDGAPVEVGPLARMWVTNP
ncbi:nickel-dependent hydrogenase large subunit, partial [Desulfovibrio sp. OttesenSCG-928-F07]|nr:nickel-dependent hydrogenase large subunit [Desulfovibrio sp. OttesenSCG-928-F07]